MNIIIHLGVHKTGTTYTQHVLLNNIKILKKNRIEFIPLNKLRKGITYKIRNAVKTNSNVQDILKEYLSKDVDTLIISDENLLGGIGEIQMKGVLYNSFRDYLALLVHQLSDHKVSFVVSFRNYGDFYTSLYSEFIRVKNKFIDFRYLFHKFDYLNYSWHQVLSDLKSIDGVENIQAISFEDFKVNNKIIFDSLLGPDFEPINTKLEADSSIMRPSLSKIVIGKSRRNQHKTKPSEIIKKIEMESDVPLVKYNPWTLSEENFLTKKYIEDSKTLFQKPVISHVSI